ncbi:MAG TPA: hypothetical protein VKB28_18060 [Solirubrobacteraceae bacterium]|nr:hypothetical protein [Solirubrobacteraceae bacterium]
MRRFGLLVSVALLLAAPQAAQAASVTTMVAGKDRVLRSAKPVKLADKRRVKVGSLRCTVSGRTPLGLLAATSLAIRVRDYGSCGRRPADAASLFVTRIGSDRNRGQDGWVYKVGRKVSSAGAGDRSGRRLRAGDRLLWFYCRAQRTGGCQRTLEATPDRASAAPGEAVRVTVRGYDDQGRGIAVAGATVTLGSATATTDAAGVAQVVVPSAGRLTLGASRAGMVAAFPGVVRAG